MPTKVRPLTSALLPQAMHQLDYAALYRAFEHTACICADVKYQYEGLGANEIRVLVIEPAQQKENISCQMIHCNLQNQRFEALSYIWGNESSREAIECMGKPCCVPTNCALAIRKLRYPDQKREIWIDAICIDQHNTAERSAQVQFMFKVYYSASRTIIYIGETTAGTCHHRELWLIMKWKSPELPIFAQSKVACIFSELQ